MYIIRNGSSVGKFRKSRKRRLISEINVTPFVDITLVLLIIFMITSPMLISGVKVDLPETNLAPNNDQEEPLSISIDKKGKIYLQDTPIEEKELVAKLKAITNEKYDSRIFIMADKIIDYGKVVGVLGDINEAGFNRVALITQIEGQNKRKQK